MNRIWNHGNIITFELLGKHVKTVRQRKLANIILLAAVTVQLLKYIEYFISYVYTKAIVERI